MIVTLQTQRVQTLEQVSFQILHGHREYLHRKQYPPRLECAIIPATPDPRTP